ncbi:hypothetical protein DFH27DRAFT_185193 [Peziza echinospora]|nr:hypothetical protein DFH27DRAFT_185193 [Peziza echinospora]
MTPTGLLMAPSGLAPPSVTLRSTASPQEYSFNAWAEARVFNQALEVAIVRYASQVHALLLLAVACCGEVISTPLHRNFLPKYPPIPHTPPHPPPLQPRHPPVPRTIRRLCRYTHPSIRSPHLRRRQATVLIAQQAQRRLNAWCLEKRGGRREGYDVPPGAG